MLIHYYLLFTSNVNCVLSVPVICENSLTTQTIKQQ